MKPPEESAKKHYHVPNLLVYGDLMHITKTSPQNMGSMEMMTGSPKT